MRGAELQSCWLSRFPFGSAFRRACDTDFFNPLRISPSSSSPPFPLHTTPVPLKPAFSPPFPSRKLRVRAFFFEFLI